MRPFHPVRYKSIDVLQLFFLFCFRYLLQFPKSGTGVVFGVLLFFSVVHVLVPYCPMAHEDDNISLLLGPVGKVFLLFASLETLPRSACVALY